MANADKRSEERHNVTLTATVYYSGEEEGLRCCVRNASTKGCMLISSHVREFPSTLEIEVAGLEEPIPARVVWVEDKQAGLNFDWPEVPDAADDPADWLELGETTVLDTSETGSTPA